jgi:TonB family protein
MKPLEQQLQSMQPRLEPLPEPPTLKQKESPSKLAVAKEAKKQEDKPIARVGVSAPGLGSGFFDKWLQDAALAMEAAYQPPPSAGRLRGNIVVVIEFSYFNGARSSIEVIQSSGDPDVDAACVRAVKDARLKPTPTSFINHPVTLRVTMPVSKTP